jgi:hypothetical protein
MPLLMTDEIQRDLQEAQAIKLRADKSLSGVRWTFTVAPRAGETAWIHGEPLTANPYERGSLGWALWLRSWWNAERGQDS